MTGNERKLLKGRGIYRTDLGRISHEDTLLIDGETIRQIGTWEKIRGEHPDLPALETNGWLFPGLINSHVHLEFDTTKDARVHWIEESPEKRFLHAALRASSMVRSGVTTVRDAGSSWSLLELRGEGCMQMPLPAMQFAGMPITVTGGHLHFMGEETDGLAEMVKAVRIRQKRGCDAVKLIVTGGQMTPGSLPERVSMTTEEITAVTAESHLLNLPVFAHCLTTEGFVRCMEGGVDCIEHIACFIRNQENGLLERVWVPEVMDRYAGQSRFFMMGLACHYHSLDEYREGRKACGRVEEFLLQQEEHMFSIFKNCIGLGLKPVCGTDAGTNGTLFEETWLEAALMSERGGLPPAEAIRICTEQTAQALGLSQITGSIREGMRADIVALEDNPLENIRSFSQPLFVMAAGAEIAKEC